MNRKYLAIGIIAVIVVAGLIFFNNDGKDSETSLNEESNQNTILATYNSLSPQAKALYYKQSESLTKEVPERIVELDELTIGCFGPSTITQMSTADTNLGGQCCGALKDVEAYNVQLKALDRFIQNNGNIDLIPKDPYDVSVEHAQKLIGFDSTITLSASQQSVYDKAMDMSHHGGPCCCKCWKWYMMSGLAKKLIVEQGWNENKIAELWDTSSSCGHDHDTNMHEHYNVPEGEENGHSHDMHSHENGHDHNAMEILDVEASIVTSPSTLNANQKGKITFKLNEDGKPLTGLVEHHARKLHVVIISKNLEIFGHIHPEDFSYGNTAGEYSVDFTFPKSGEYLIAIDGMTNKGKFSEQFVINVVGETKQTSVYTNYNIKSKVGGNNEQASDKFTEPIIFSEVENGEYEIVIGTPSKIEKGKEATLSFTIMRGGSPLNDLTNYLDAPIHFAIVKNDFSDFMHEHWTLPGGSHETSGSFGPTLELKTTFETSGTYQLIGQIKHENKIIVFPFTIKVE